MILVKTSHTIITIIVRQYCGCIEQTPVQQAFLLQQRLTEVNHPDHTLITYSNLGHVFYPSSQWSTRIGPIEQYVLADIYTWLEAHSGLSHSFATTVQSYKYNYNFQLLNIL